MSGVVTTRVAPPAMVTYTTHASLLSRLRDLEDQGAWREFDERYRELILRYCRRRGLQPTDAEDVRQAVMLSLARHLESFCYRPERGRFRAYLGRIVSNAISRLHRRPSREEIGLEGVMDDAGTSAETEERDALWEREWMLHHYRTAMDVVRSAVDPRSVDVFERLLAGESIDGVAEAVGMTRDAVHKVKQRMRARLEREVARQVADEDESEARRD